MKTVKIKMSGHMLGFIKEVIIDPDFGDIDETEQFELEDAGKLDGNMIQFVVMDELQSLTAVVDGEEIDIQKTKGKYIKSKSVLKERLGIQDNEKLWFGELEDDDVDVEYEIELQDDEEFDPKKLQFVKSDYELDFLPFAIIVEWIVYDGKKYYTEDTDNWQDDVREVRIVDYNLPCYE